MKNPKNRSVSVIQYYVITHSDETNFIHIPQEFHNCLISLRKFPKDLIQLIQSLEFYEMTTCSKLYQGLDLYILDSDLLKKSTDNTTIKKFVDHYSSRENIKVFFINEQITNLDQIIDQLNCLDGTCFFLPFNLKNNKIKDSFKSRSIKDVFDLIEKLKQHEDRIKSNLNHLSDDYQELEFDVKVADNLKGVDEYKHFLPAANNFFTLNQISRNFWSKESSDELSNPEETLKNEFDNKDRWQILLDKVKKIDYINHQLYDNNICKRVNFYDNYYESIILIFPFQNPRLKSLLNIRSRSKNEQLLHKVITTEQNIDFKSSIEFSQKISDKKAMKLMRISAIKEQERFAYLDALGYLHSSFQYSPVIRFPLLGKSINKHLAFFKPERKNFRSASPRKTIWKFGEELEQKTITPNISDYLRARNGQVFAISDLPVEWLQLDKVPLCFSHDVCRLPETNYRSLLNKYIVNQRFTTIIDENILERTLVVLGASSTDGEDEEFKKWYSIVYDLSKRLKFKIVNADSKNDVIKAVKENKPDLLIFDCHGDFDEKKLSSFLWINNEKLTGEDIISNNISAPLVFLSACNTNPNYGYTGLIADAFFEAGALSVTSTFLPINVDEGSILYIRLLNNLSYVSNKAIHQNWLNFVSHLIRTSIIQRSFYTKHKTRPLTKDQSDNLSELQSKSMVFGERREIYQNLNLEGIENEYLFYSQLGRSDLILFNSWLEKRKIKKKKTVPNN